jgi:hypothetical protein
LTAGGRWPEKAEKRAFSPLNRGISGVVEKKFFYLRSKTNFFISSTIDSKRTGRSSVRTRFCLLNPLPLLGLRRLGSISAAYQTETKGAGVANYL